MIRLTCPFSSKECERTLCMFWDDERETCLFKTFIFDIHRIAKALEDIEAEGRLR